MEFLILIILSFIIWKLYDLELKMIYIQSDVRKIKKNLEDK